MGRSLPSDRGVTGRLLQGASACAVACACGLGGADPSLAQAVLPSQVTPPVVRPQNPEDRSAALPAQPAAPSAVASPATDLALSLAGATLSGGYADMGASHAAFDRAIRDEVHSLAGLFAAARALERAYADAGHMLVRVTVPPQRLATGGLVQIVVIDGYVEAVDVDGVPAAARRTVAARLAPLIGRHHLHEAELERAVLLAGETAGVSLRSALTAGEGAGATRLVVAGEHDRWQARAGADNRLPASLGRWQWNASLVGNGLLGRGDQSYVFIGAQTDIARHGFGRPRLGMVGGGTTVPLTAGGLSLGIAVLAARTQLDPPPGVPRTIGTFARAGVDLTAALERRRGRSIDLRLALERVVQSNTAPDFATQLSRDRYAALRLGLDWRDQGRTTFHTLALTLSRGLAGRQATPLVPLSREGARGRFTVLQANARMNWTLARGETLDLRLRAQSGMGRPLFLSEQFALDAETGVSSFAGGSFNTDSGLTLRSEFSLPPQAVLRNTALTPYVFAAGGAGTVAQPTAAEQARLRAAALGFGLRLDLTRGPTGADRGAPGLQLGLEFGRGFSNVAGRPGGNRTNLTVALRF